MSFVFLLFVVAIVVLLVSHWLGLKRLNDACPPLDGEELRSAVYLLGRKVRSPLFWTRPGILQLSRDRIRFTDANGKVRVDEPRAAISHFRFPNRFLDTRLDLTIHGHRWRFYFYHWLTAGDLWRDALNQQPVPDRARLRPATIAISLLLVPWVIGSALAVRAMYQHGDWLAATWWIVFGAALVAAFARELTLRPRDIAGQIRLT